MTTSSERRKALAHILEQRVLVLDGAMGTMLHQVPLSIDVDYQGRENCPEILNATRPDVIGDVHRAYLEAGADIIETNSFGGSRMTLAENQLDPRTYELNFAAAQIARRVADEFSTTGKPRFVAGSIGPTTKNINTTGTATFEQFRSDYYEQAKALVEGGADFLLIETAFDTGSLKAGLIAVQQLRDELGIEIPVVASATIFDTGAMLAGQAVDALYASIANHKLMAIGMNCATGPDLMTDHIRSLHQMSQYPLSCYPNAGLPDEEGHSQRVPRHSPRSSSASSIAAG